MKIDSLIVKILEKHLKKEVGQIVDLTQQGFDVFIYTEFLEITKTLENLLHQEIRINSRAFRLITEPENIATQNSDDLNFAFIPTVLLGNHVLNHGTGFVRYHIESPDKLLNNIASAIEEILIYFKLERYIDCFDAKVFLKLKEIAKLRGVRCLIDAVVQTAYLAGFLGKQEPAYQYLDTFKISENFEKNTNPPFNAPIELCAKRFLSHCISYGDSSFDFLKSCLSFYVVSKQGLTMTKASQILNISRTTLIEYLKVAEKMGVSSFFEYGTR